MNRNFHYMPAGTPEPVVFEKIFAEKPGGGLMPTQSYDVPAGAAVGFDGEGNLTPIKAYKLYAAVAQADTSIKLVKGSGVAVNDIIGHGAVAVKATAVDKTTSEDYDTVTVTMGVAIAKGTVLFGAKAESVVAGYYDAESTDEGALKVVASGASDGQINLADVTPYKGSKTPLAADDYVIYKAEVKSEPKVAPQYILGTNVHAGEGALEVKLVNGANLRKETAMVADEVVALMKSIEKV